MTNYKYQAKNIYNKIFNYLKESGIRGKQTKQNKNKESDLAEHCRGISFNDIIGPIS